MVRAIVRKEGNRVYLEVAPNDPQVVELQDGEELNVALDKSDAQAISDNEFDAIVDRLIKEHRDALDYLAQ